MNVVVYRTCDRPKYTARTFPHLLRNTPARTRVIMVENSGDKANIEKNRQTFESYADDRCDIHVANKRLGITRPLTLGIDLHVRRHGKPKFVFNVDDDIMVPSPIGDVYWNDVLIAMLEGPWEVAGIWRRIKNDAPAIGDGFAAGIEARFIAAGCCGFRYSSYEAKPFDHPGIAAFNIWSSRLRCGWSTKAFYKEIDRDGGDESLRDTEYAQYSEYVDQMRKRRGTG